MACAGNTVHQRGFHLIWILLCLVLVALVTRFYLDGQSLAQFDEPLGEVFHSDSEPGEEYYAVVASLGVGSGPIRNAPRRERLALMSAAMLLLPRRWKASCAT